MSTIVNTTGSSQSNINTSQIQYQAHVTMSSHTTMPNVQAMMHSTSQSNSMSSTMQSAGQSQQQMPSSAKSGINNTDNPPTQILTRPRLQDLVREIDSTEQLDEEVEELLLQIADEFVENTVNSACLLAKHRNMNTIEVKDVQLYLERMWGMWIPGFGTDELRPYKRATVTEAHKHRLALIRKALKKY